MSGEVLSLEVLFEDCEHCGGSGCAECLDTGEVAVHCRFCNCVVPVWPDDVRGLEDDAGYCTCEVCDCGALMSMVEPGCYECKECKPTAEELAAAAARLRLDWG